MEHRLLDNDEAEVIEPDAFSSSRQLVELGRNDNQVGEILRNLSGNLQLTSRQSRRIRSAVTGVSAGGAHDILGPYIGEIPAAILGAAAGAWLAKKILSE